MTTGAGCTTGLTALARLLDGLLAGGVTGADCEAASPPAFAAADCERWSASWASKVFPGAAVVELPVLGGAEPPEPQPAMSRLAAATPSATARRERKTE